MLTNLSNSESINPGCNCSIAFLKSLTLILPSFGKSYLSNCLLKIIFLFKQKLTSLLTKSSLFNEELNPLLLIKGKLSLILF